MFTFTLLLYLWAGLASPFIASTAGAEVGRKDANLRREELAWSASRKLSWEDFKALPEDNNPHHALTAANLAVDARCSNNALLYDVKCVFLPAESWSKNKQSLKLLEHEQLHFDLTEVHARQLRKKLKEISPTCQDAKGRLSIAVGSAFKVWKAEQDKFDEASNHGLNTAEEHLWAQNIAQRLRALQAYR